MDNKNATLSFSFYSDDYPDIDLTFHCDENLTMEELIDYFKRFVYAMSFSSEAIEKYFSKDH
jgi:hypothetical protein